MPYDIILETEDKDPDKNQDFKIANGDFVVGETTIQNQRLLLLCQKGEFKEFPDRCVGLHNFLETADSQSLAREIDVDFTKDGMKVRRIVIDIPNIEIDADYE